MAKGANTAPPPTTRQPSVIDKIVAEAKIDPFSSESLLEKGLLRRGEKAIAANQAAAQADVVPRHSASDAVFYGLDARKARERSAILLEPSQDVRVLCGEAACWDNKAGEGAVGETAWINRHAGT